MNSLEKVALLELAKWSARVPMGLMETAPIDPEAIGLYWGVRKVIKRELDIPGFLQRLDASHSLMFINNDDSPGRQRFTCAHELGHIVLGGNGSPEISCRKPNQVDRSLERCCDIIATEILMPRLLFSSVAEHIGWSLKSATILADRFQVTVLAAAIRLAELAKEPVLMAAWRSEANPLQTLKHKWSLPNQTAKVLKPAARWKTGPEALPVIYQALRSTGVQTGVSTVLVSANGETRYKSVPTEALRIGRRGDGTTVSFHYLTRSP